MQMHADLSVCDKKLHKSPTFSSKQEATFSYVPYSLFPRTPYEDLYSQLVVTQVPD